MEKKENLYNVNWNVQWQSQWKSLEMSQKLTNGTTACYSNAASVVESPGLSGVSAISFCGWFLTFSV